MGRFFYVGLPLLLDKGRDALKQAVTDACEDLVRAAQEKTPVDTGTLRASIHVDSVTVQGNGVTGVVATGGEADYAIYVEEGTSRGMPAFKYMAGALIENAQLYRKAMERAVSDEF